MSMNDTVHHIELRLCLYLVFKLQYDLGHEFIFIFGCPIIRHISFNRMFVTTVTFFLDPFKHFFISIVDIFMRTHMVTGYDGIAAKCQCIIRSLTFHRSLKYLPPYTLPLSCKYKKESTS